MADVAGGMSYLAVSKLVEARKMKEEVKDE
jgi:hypothetical protein